jgi:hypothetical protein
MSGLPPGRCFRSRTVWITGTRLYKCLFIDEICSAHCLHVGYTCILSNVLYIWLYSMCQSPSEPDNRSASHAILYFLWIQKLHYRVRKRLPPDPVPNQMNPVHTSHSVSWRSFWDKPPTYTYVSQVFSSFRDYRPKFYMHLMCIRLSYCCTIVVMIVFGVRNQLRGHQGLLKLFCATLYSRLYYKAIFAFLENRVMENRVIKTIGSTGIKWLGVECSDSPSRM